MENINRKRITILQIIIFNAIIFFTLVSIAVFKIIPALNLYDKEKEELHKINQELTNIKKEWLSYDGFISLMAKNPLQDAYLVALIKTISPDFYKKNILNTLKQWSFDDFIKNKEVYLEKKTKERDISYRQKSIQEILPEYTGNSLTKNEQALTDFKFINYIESILYAFNLVSIDSIGVSDVLQVDDYVTQEEKKMEQWVNPKIYYIPINLKITWRKTDILDFLYFAENVGAITIQDWNFSVFNDKTLSQKLSWDKNGEEYNIYENQVFDIEDISMNKYIDSDISSSRVDTQEFKDFIKSTQGNEKFSFEMKMRFYIKWMPDYQIKNFIKTTLEKYNTLKKESNSLLTKMTATKAESSIDIITMNKLRSVDFDIKLLEPDIKTLRNMYTKTTDNIEPAYKEAIRINTIFEVFESTLNKNKQALETLKNNKK
jgi:hypothetical protein